MSNDLDGSNLTSEPNPEGARLLVQLHCAEYQALMARIAQKSTLQYYLWGALVAYVGLAANTWTKEPRFPYQRSLLWGSVFVAQIVTIFWFKWEAEILQTVIYLRGRLRPLVAKALPPHSDFWSDDSFLQGISGVAAWWELPPLLVPLVALGLSGPSVYRDPCGSLAGIALNLAVFFLAAYQARRTFLMARLISANESRNS